MDFKNMKVMVGIIVAIVAQCFGMIWYIAQLDSTVTNNAVAIESLEGFDDTALIETMEDFDNRLDDIEKKQAIIENEMRSIMSDHSSFNEVLKDLGKSGYGDNRQYGNYGGN